MLNILHYFHVIYVQAHLPNEPNKLLKIKLKGKIPFAVRGFSADIQFMWWNLLFLGPVHMHKIYTC